jgi:hypothetical protein
MQLGPKALRHAIHRQTKEAGGERPGICLVHIPKTGGTSVAAAIRPHYRFRHFNVNSAASSRTTEYLYTLSPGSPGFWEQRQMVRAALAMYSALKGKRFVTGHVAYCPQFDRLKDHGFRITTVLRDPVRRWFSAYFYNRYKATEHGRTDLEFDQFLESAEAADFGATYVRFIGGPREDGQYTSREAVENAKANLERFDIVGFLDDLPTLQEAFREQTALRLRFPHRRRSPAPPKLERQIKADPQYQRAVEKLCAPDPELFQHARNLFGS